MSDSNLKETTKKYFEAFSNKNTQTLSELYADSVSLRDWDVDLSGKAAVLDANRKLFASVESVQISLLLAHQEGRTVASEIEIIIDDETILKVVDVIDFDETGKISNIRAYKG